MANFNPTTGKWNSSGGGDFNSRIEAEQRDGSGGNFTYGSSWLTAIWKLFCLIPKLIGGAVGHLTGLLMKLGMVGKVILTALVAATVYIVVVIAFNELSFMIPVLNIILGVLMIALGLLAGVWFWMKHYQVVKQMSHGNIVKLTTQCVMICFWGAIILGTFFEILRLMGKIAKSPIGFGGAIGIPLVVAIVYWLMKANNILDLESDDDLQADASEEETSDTAPSKSFPDAQPTSLPADDKRCSTGDLVWARWSGDGNLYFAGIADTSSSGVKVTFYDGVEEEVSRENIFYAGELQKSGLTPHGNWENKGSFYPCDILEFRKNSVRVKYTEDKVEEELPYQGLVFIK